MIQQLPLAQAQHERSAPDVVPVVAGERGPAGVVSGDQLQGCPAPRFWPAGADGVEQRRLQVEAGDRGAHPLAGGEPGAGGDQRDTHRVLVQAGLPPHAELAEHLTVVGGVADHCVLGQARGVQGIAQSSELVVHVGDSAEVSLPEVADELSGEVPPAVVPHVQGGGVLGRLLLDAVGRQVAQSLVHLPVSRLCAVRRMGRVDLDRHRPGLAQPRCPGLQPVDRRVDVRPLGCVHVLHRAVGGGGAHQFRRRALGLDGVGSQTLPRAGHPQHLGEPEGERVPVEVGTTAHIDGVHSLLREHSAIAGMAPFEHLGVVVGLGLVGIPAGHERSPRGHTQGRGAVGILVHRATGGEPVQVGCAHHLVTVGRGVARIVLVADE